MSASNKIIQAAAGNAAGEGTYVEDVFSTYLYTGTDPSNQTITNGIDLDGEGGLVWIKDRSTAYDHALYDTERGIYKYLESNQPGAEVSNTTHLRAFNSDGFDIGVNLQINSSGDDYASWTFRKAPKFFDVVTYTGNGVSGRTVAHNLGSVPGCIIVKAFDGSGYNWAVYHRGVNGGVNPENYVLFLNDTMASAGPNSVFWGGTAPTSTTFSVGNYQNTNQSGKNFVAYLFAHNDGDGEFGEGADQDIIKCGSVTMDGSGNASITLGFEPSWVLLKRTDSTGSWAILDTMRGWAYSGTAYLQPNTSNAEGNYGSTDVGEPTATGFEMKSWGANASYIYIAIRRGPMKTPTSGTDVFAIDTRGSTGDSNTPAYRSTFPVDLSWYNKDTDGSITSASARLTGNTQLYLELTNSEAGEPDVGFDHMNGMFNSTSTDATKIAWMFGRAPGFFDVVADAGTGTAKTVNHNLGVVPELMIRKGRVALTGNNNWSVYVSSEGATKGAYLTNNAFQASASFWNDTTPTASVFSVGNGNVVNQSSKTYITYLFATVAGVSKVGSYTGNGSSQTINCGFSAGARFVLIKRTDSTSNWNVFDTARGIVAGNDPRLTINTQDAQDTGDDGVDPDSSGFAVNYIATNDDDVNVSGGTYIFLAIA